MDKIALIFALIIGTVSADAKTYSVVSPNGTNEIRLSTEPTLTYQILRDGRALTEPSALALEVAGKPLLGGAGLTAKDVVKAVCSGQVASPIYKKASVDETAKTLKVSFGDWSVDLVARNDGVAYRFATAFPEDEIMVVSELADVSFASGEQEIWAAPNFGAGAGDPLQNSWESRYTKYRVADAPRDLSVVTNGLWYAPVTLLYPNGAAMCVQESDLWSYPGWNFQGGADGKSLKALFGRYPKKTIYSTWGQPDSMERLRYQRILEREDFLARTKGTRTFPWRVFTLAGSLAKLVESDIVYALASPNAIGDLSWVKPGKVSWDWWCRWNLTGVDFKAGINTRTYEHFIDFAARHGIEYVIFDEGWSRKLRILEINPEVDVPHLIRYANARGVGIVLWAAWSQFIERIDEVVSHYAEMGAKGFKVDFMDRDDQVALDFLRDFAETCARHHLIVDYHGMSKPAGFSRTYPNVLNFEGIQGLEFLKSRRSEYFPEMDCTHVFTRLLAGPADYTPGAMRNFCRGCYDPHPFTPGSYGTRVHQMALMTLFDAPLEMLCDSPSLYEANRECFDFMSALPVTWDDTVALGGEMDAYAALARRKGDDWYAAVICGWAGRTEMIDTAFLGSGEWTAEIFADGVNAGRDAVDYVHEKKAVRAGEKLTVVLAPGGGWTARFVRKVESSSEVRAAVGPYVDRGEIAGVISVLSDSDYNETWDIFGFADVENNVPMKPDTLFAIFSMSKTVLGAALMCAIDDGLVDLDDRVSKFLPEFADVRFADGRRPTREITLRDVTSHVDGITGEPWLVDNTNSLRTLACQYAALPLGAEPGTVFRYGTVRFAVAAACLEVATGRKYEDFIKERIFDKLGMTDTTFDPTPEQVSRLVKAYTTSGGPFRPAADACSRQLKFPKVGKLEPVAGSGLYSTAADMIRFSQMLAHHGDYKGTTVISRRTFDEIFAKIQVPETLHQPYTCGAWLYGDWFGHEGAMRTDQRANLKTGESRVFFIQTENKAGPAFFNAKIAWHKACDVYQKEEIPFTDELVKSHENDFDRSKAYQK